MGKGYAEGPAAEEAERRLEELAAGGHVEALPDRAAVYGSTDEKSQRHFLGWLGEVDPDELFDTGAAYGITVVRRTRAERPAGAPPPTANGCPEASETEAVPFPSQPMRSEEQ